MKHKILKTILALSLVSLSSMAIAEGKYATKFPLKGVKASPSFGMTATDKQAFQENLANIEMCSQESSEWITEYSASNTYAVVVYKTSDTKTHMVFIDGIKLYDKTTSRTGTNQGHFENTGIYKITTRMLTGEFNGDFAYYYDLSHIIKTENYDWCVDNGYQTKN